MRVIFEFPTLKLVLNSIQTFAKMLFYDYVGGWKSAGGFRKAIQF